MYRNLRLLYVTAPSESSAKEIALEILERRLAACVNIIPKIQAMYRWDNKIQQNEEVILYIKTTYMQLDNLIACIKKIHPYQCPCIISININEQEGNLPFLDWVAKESNANDPKQTFMFQKD